MAIRIVTESERMVLVRDNIKKTAEILVALKIATEEDNLNNKIEIINQINEGLELLSSAQEDTFKDDEGSNTLEIDVIVVGDRVVKEFESIEDTV